MNPLLQYIRAATTDAAKAEGLARQAAGSDEWDGYADTLAAAFTLAAQRQFGGKPAATVVNWVADLRSQLDDPWDPDLAPASAMEAMLRAAVTDDDSAIEGLSQSEILDVEMLLTPQILRQLALSPAETDSFFVEAEALAQEWAS